MEFNIDNFRDVLQQNTELKQQYNEASGEITALSLHCDEVEQQRDIAVAALEGFASVTISDMNRWGSESTVERIVCDSDKALKQIKGE